MPSSNRSRQDSNVKAAYIGGFFLLLSVVVAGVFGFWQGIFVPLSPSETIPALGIVAGSTQPASVPVATNPTAVPPQIPNVNGRWRGYIDFVDATGLVIRQGLEIDIDQNGTQFVGEAGQTCNQCPFPTWATLVNAWVSYTVSGSIDANGAFILRHGRIMQTYPPGFYGTCNDVIELEYNERNETISGNYLCNGVQLYAYME